MKSTLARKFKRAQKSALRSLIGATLRKRCYDVGGVARGLVTLEPSQGVLTVENAIATRTGANLVDGRLITTFHQPIDGKSPGQHDFFLFTTRRLFPKIYESDVPVVTISTGWQGSFYHWVYEVLPRLDYVDNVEKLFVEAYFPYQIETLRHLGFDESRIINAKHYDAVRTPKLIIPPIPVSPDRHAVDFLRKKFYRRAGPKKRIYISRGDAKTRRIVEEDKIIDFLKGYGFVSYTLSGLTFQQQVDLFASAEAIVTAHGAGLSHLAFCDPGTPFIEIFSPRYTHPCYEKLATLCNLKYHSIFGECVDDHYDPDIRIDLSAIQDFCRKNLS